MDFSPETIRLIVETMIILILSIAVHEFGHAFVADKLGDRLPRHEGRVTLNPMAHADPIGTLAIPAFMLIASAGHTLGFGWGRPVRVQPQSFTRKLRMRTGHLLVAAAGPMMNVLFAVTIALVLFALFKTGVVAQTSGGIYEALSRAILMNFVLAIFNLVPAPPLDGGTVLAGLLPDRMMPAYNRFAQFGIFIIIAIMLIPALRQIIFTPAFYMYRGVTGILGL